MHQERPISLITQALAFRFNRRKSRRLGMLFYRLPQNAVVTKPTRHRPSRARLPIGNHNRQRSLYQGSYSAICNSVGFDIYLLVRILRGVEIEIGAWKKPGGR